MFKINDLVRKVSSNEEITKGENLLRYSSFNHDYITLYIDRDVKDQFNEFLDEPRRDAVLCCNNQQVLSKSSNITLSAVGTDKFDDNYNALTLRVLNGSNGLYLNRNDYNSIIFHTWNMHNISKCEGGSYPANVPVTISLYIQTASPLGPNLTLKCKLGGNYSNDKQGTILTQGITSEYQRVTATITPDYQWNDLIIWIEGDFGDTPAATIRIAKPKVEFGKIATSWNESSYDLLNNTDYNTATYAEFDPEYFRQAGDTDSDVIQKAHNFIKGYRNVSGGYERHYGVLKLSRTYTLTRTFKWDASFVGIVGNGYGFILDIDSVGGVKQYGIELSPSYNATGGGSPVNNRIIKISNLPITGVAENSYDKKGKPTMTYKCNGILFKGKDSVCNAAHLCLENMMITKTDSAFTFSDNSYMIEVSKVNFTSNRIHVHFLKDTYNAGERIVFDNCNFGGQDYYEDTCCIMNLGVGELFFHHCSFDWIKHLFYNAGVIIISDCHIEIPYYVLPSPTQYIYTTDEKYNSTLTITEFDKDANGNLLTDDDGRYTFKNNVQSRPYIRKDNNQKHFFGENMGYVAIKGGTFLINSSNPTVKAANLLLTDAQLTTLNSLKSDSTPAGIKKYNDTLLKYMKTINLKFINKTYNLFANNNNLVIKDVYVLNSNYVYNLATDFNKYATGDKFTYPTPSAYQLLPDTPQGLSLPSTVGVNDDIYIFNNGTTDVYKYNTKLKTYVKLSDMPIKLGGYFNTHMATYVEPYIYFYSSVDYSIYAYNIDTDIYEKRITLSEKLISPTLVSVDENVYLIGDTSSGSTQRLYGFNTKTNTLTLLKNIPYKFAMGVAVATEKNIYLFGSTYKNANGEREFGKTAYVYNVASGVYTALPDIPVSIASAAGVYIGNCIIYLFGSSDAKTQATKFYTSSKTYTSLSDIPFSVSNDSAHYLNNNIYINFNSNFYKFNIAPSASEDVVYPDGTVINFAQSTEDTRAGKTDINFKFPSKYTACFFTLSDCILDKKCADPLLLQLKNGVNLDNYKITSITSSGTTENTTMTMVNVDNIDWIKVAHTSAINNYTTFEYRVNNINVKDYLIVSAELKLAASFAQLLYGPELDSNGRLQPNDDNTGYKYNTKTAFIGGYVEMYNENDKLLCRLATFTNKDKPLSASIIDCNATTIFKVQKKFTISDFVLPTPNEDLDEVVNVSKGFSLNAVSYVKVLIRTKDSTSSLYNKAYYIKSIDVQGC